MKILHFALLAAITGCASQEPLMDDKTIINDHKLSGEALDTKHGFHNFPGQWVSTVYIDRGLNQHAIVLNQDQAVPATFQNTQNPISYNPIDERQSIHKSQSDKHATQRAETSSSNKEANAQKIKLMLEGEEGLSNATTVLCQHRSAPEHKCTLKNEIQFEFDSSDLTQEARLVLDQIAIDKNLKLEVVGFADGIGSKSYNKELAKKRSETVRNYLLSKGIKNVSVATNIESKFEGSPFRKAILVGLE